MDEPGEQNEMRKETAKGILLLVGVVGVLSVGTLGPGAFTLENVVAVVATLQAASRALSMWPVLSLALLGALVAVAAHTEFGPFGDVTPSRRRRADENCRICNENIDPSRGKCPYCRTSDPVGE